MHDKSTLPENLTFCLLFTCKKMPSLKYGGVIYSQVRHALRCKLCLDTIESKHINDFKMCSCGSVGIDGGIFPGNRIIGDCENIEPRSMYQASIREKKYWIPQEIIEIDFHRSCLCKKGIVRYR